MKNAERMPTGVHAVGKPIAMQDSLLPHRTSGLDISRWEGYLAPQGVFAMFVGAGRIQQCERHAAVLRLRGQRRQWGAYVEEHLITYLMIARPSLRAHVLNTLDHSRSQRGAAIKN